MEILEVVIGMVFAFLLLSLLGTIIQEYIATLISLRGKVLLEAIVQMLEKEDREKWRNLIRNSKVYQKYVETTLFVRKLPAYLSADQVISILQDIMTSDPDAAPEGDRGLLDTPVEGGEPKVTTRDIRDVSLRSNLQLLQLEKAELNRPGSRSLGPEGEITDLLPEKVREEIEKAKAAVARNFHEMMDRATGWYKRRVQVVLMILGLIIAAAFNADTFDMYRALSDNPENRREILAIANNFVEQDRQAYYAPPADTLTPPPPPSLEQLRLTRARLDTLLNNELAAVHSPLGLGWDGFLARIRAEKEVAWTVWLFKLIGWIVTALAISLGASFWFDLLKLLMNIRAAGNPPSKSEVKKAPPPTV